MRTLFPARQDLHHVCWRSQINILKDRDNLGDPGMDGKIKQSDQNVSVHLTITVQIIRCTETF